VRRRQLLGLIAGAVAFRPLGGAAQNVLPAIGFLHSGLPAQNRGRLDAYLQGLRDGGFKDGRNVRIDYRWAEGDAEKLPELAGRLVDQGVAVVATPGSTPAAVAAIKATATIPIVFAVGADPVVVGLVQSLAHPGGNATGITSQNGDLGAKQLQLLRQLAPDTGHYFALINPTSQIAAGFLNDLKHGAARFGLAVDVLHAANDVELEAAFAGLSVIQADKFDMTINLGTAKALGLAVPPLLLAQAGEVIP
jgi:putative ABC transport system substrate-binding protein